MGIRIGVVGLFSLLCFPIFGKTLGVGDTIPTVNLISFTGKKYAVNDYASKSGKRNLLLVFFRTGTCSVCIQQLRELASRFDEVLKYNATILAVSLDDAIVQSKTSQLIQGKLPILLDPGGKAVRSFGIFNPQDKLAKPSLYLVAPNQKILYSYVGKGLRDRPPTSEVLEVIRHYSGLAPFKKAATGN